MRKNNLPIEKKSSIFSRIVEFFKNIFANEIDANIQQTDNYFQSSQHNSKNSFVENIKISSMDEIIALQQDYKSGKIKEEDLTEEQYNSLIKLYDEQIDTYKTSISMKKVQLKGYKQRITEMKKSVQ